MRRYRDDIANTLTYRLTNARVESLNTKIRLLTRIRVRASSSAAPLIALIMLHLGGYDLTLPAEPHQSDPQVHRPNRTNLTHRYSRRAG